MAWYHPHWTQHLAREHWLEISFRDILQELGEPSIIPTVYLASTVNIFSSEKNLIRPDASKNTIATRLVLAASENICRIFNVYDLYQKSSSAIRRIVGSLTLTIDANFRNNCFGSSEISAWTLSTTPGVLAVHSFEWLFLAGILEPSLDCFKAIYFAS